jgi:DNA-directed RNA polymerase specialized sigma24 family protein
MTDTANPDRMTETLIARTALGDPAAHASLCAIYGPLFHAIALGILGNATDTDAALQDISAALWRDAADHPGSGLSGRGWLVTLARGEALALRRTRPATPDSSADAVILADFAPDPPPFTTGPGSRLTPPDPDRAEALARAVLYGDDLAALASRFGMSVPRLRHWLRDGLAVDDDADALCVEQAIGLLPADEAAAFAARIAADPALCARAILWAEELAAFVVAQTPPDPDPAPAAQISTPEGQGWLVRLGILPAILGALIAGLLVLGADRAGLLMPDPAAIAAP